MPKKKTVKKKSVKKKSVKKRKPRKSKKKQTELAGFSRPKIKELDTAADDYRDARDARQDATDEEVKLKTKLMALMHKHDLRFYRIPDTDPPLVIALEVVDETVKVRKLTKKELEGKEDAPKGKSGKSKVAKKKSGRGPGRPPKKKGSLKGGQGSPDMGGSGDLAK